MGICVAAIIHCQGSKWEKRSAGRYALLSFPSLPPFPLPSLPLPLPSPSPPFPPLPSFPFPLPLEVVPFNPAIGVWGSAVSSASGVWDGAPVEIEFSAF